TELCESAVVSHNRAAERFRSKLHPLHSTFQRLDSRFHPLHAGFQRFNRGEKLCETAVRSHKEIGRSTRCGSPADRCEATFVRNSGPFAQRKAACNPLRTAHRLEGGSKRTGESPRRCLSPAIAVEPL